MWPPALGCMLLHRIADPTTGGHKGQYISKKKKGEPSRQKEIRSAILYKEDCHVQQNRKDDPTMYRVRYLDQTDKMSEQVHLRMLEDVYPRELLQGCAQLSVTRAQKARRHSWRLGSVQ